MQKSLLAVVIAASALMGTVASADDLSLSNKWRVEVSEGANSDGVIRFQVTPKDGQPVPVDVQIKDGRRENGVAQDIRDAFRATLDKDIYKSETDDGEDVLLKKRKGPDFELKLVESTVKSVRIDIEKE